MKKKALFRWYRAVHVRVREELKDGEHCIQRACILTTCNEGNISDLAILLRGWNFASGSMAVASCIVTSSLLMKRNSIATVSIIHTNPICGLDENPHATAESNFQQRFSVNVCCAVLDNHLIGPFIWKVVLQEKRTSNFYRRNCPNIWRMSLWINEVVCISYMTELLLILHVKVEIS